jgi:hypothetical protein
MGFGLSRMSGKPGMNMAMALEGVSIHTMDSVHGLGPVFYASLPCRQHTTIPCEGDGMYGEEDKLRLASTLWDHLEALESPLWKHCQASRSVQVVRGMLGRPHLLLGEDKGPAISFSECGGRVWAALCGDESDIGIDAAGTDEFGGDYPFHRVFHPQELEHALSLEGGDTGKASALLWSVKEAVVKALGGAFHLVDPLQITICPSAEGTAKDNEGHTFHAGLSGKALMRFPMTARGSIWVRSLPQRKMWLSIALLNRRLTDHE